MQPTDLDPGTILEPLDSVVQAEHDVCSNIRIKNTDDYQSFSILGLVIILAVGTPIVMLSLMIEPCVAALRMRRRRQYQHLPDVSNNEKSSEKNVSHSSRDDDREVARIADCILQLQRKVLTSAAPETDWEAKMQIVPVTTDPDARLPLPRRVKPESKNTGATDGDVENDYEYRREEGVAVQEVKAKTDDQHHGLLQQPQEDKEDEGVEIGEAHGNMSNPDNQTITRVEGRENL